MNEMTPAPAPLPPEEIEEIGRLERYVAEAKTEYERLHRQAEADRKIRAMLPALLAEIEAGRAGAERALLVQRMAVEAAYREGFADSKKIGDVEAAWRMSALNGAVYDPDDAALRQAAQPSDGAQYEGSTLHRLHLAEAQIKAADEALDRAGVPRDDHRTEGELSLPARIDLLQSYREDEASDAEDEIEHMTQAAQTAGRVEYEPICTNGHDRCYEGAFEGCPYCELRVVRATPPTAGAVDDGEG